MWPQRRASCRPKAEDVFTVHTARHAELRAFVAALEALREQEAAARDEVEAAYEPEWVAS